MITHQIGFYEIQLFIKIIIFISRRVCVIYIILFIFMYQKIYETILDVCIIYLRDLSKLLVILI